MLGVSRLSLQRVTPITSCQGVVSLTVNGRAPAALYRMHDAEGRLLYVGMTEAPLSRAMQHAKEKHWRMEIRKISVEWFDNHEEAAKAEAAAIKREVPIWNVHHGIHRTSKSGGNCAEAECPSEHVAPFGATASRDELSEMFSVLTPTAKAIMSVVSASPGLGSLDLAAAVYGEAVADMRMPGDSIRATLLKANKALASFGWKISGCMPGKKYCLHEVSHG